MSAAQAGAPLARAKHVFDSHRVFRAELFTQLPLIQRELMLTELSGVEHQDTQW